MRSLDQDPRPRGRCDQLYEDAIGVADGDSKGHV